ncbi:hypothetical protein CIK05_11425 [Bdellovibrio sp. qaytius]|nr:hypothetical protein CIK05_11425 [Bdellovibrio sp. qaytius]
MQSETSMESTLLATEPIEEYLKILTEEYRVRRAKNNKYSIRAFAKYLEVSHSMLSQIFLNQKGISEQMAEKISDKLHLSALEKSIFINSVVKCFARSHTEKQKAAATLEKLKISYQNSKLLTKEGLANINHWSYIAIFESIRLNKANTVDAIGIYLNLPAKNIERVLNDLLYLKIIQIEAGQIKVSTSIQTTSDISNLAFKEYHVSLTEKMNEALEQHSANELEFQNAILSFRDDQMLEAKKMIREFVDQFNSQFHIESPAPPLYSLSVGLFKLNRD